MVSGLILREHCMKWVSVVESCSHATAPPPSHTHSSQHIHTTRTGRNTHTPTHTEQADATSHHRTPGQAREHQIQCWIFYPMDIQLPRLTIEPGRGSGNSHARGISTHCYGVATQPRSAAFGEQLIEIHDRFSPTHHPCFCFCYLL